MILTIRLNDKKKYVSDPISFSEGHRILNTLRDILLFHKFLRKYLISLLNVLTIAS